MVGKLVMCVHEYGGLCYHNTYICQPTATRLGIVVRKKTTVCPGQKLVVERIQISSIDIPPLPLLGKTLLYKHWHRGTTHLVIPRTYSIVNASVGQSRSGDERFIAVEISILPCPLFLHHT